MLVKGLTDLVTKLKTITGLVITDDPRNISPNCVLVQAPAFVSHNYNILDVTFPITVIGLPPANHDSLVKLLTIVSALCVANVGVIDGRPVSVDVGGTIAPGYELNVKWQVQNA